MGRKDSHLARVGRTSGFGIHLRAFGVSQQKMDAWILNYYNHNRNLLAKKTGGPDFDARMAADAISRGEYKPDRSYSLSGGAAYSREKQVYMKYLGLATKGHMVTERMKVYAAALTADPSPRMDLLRRYAASFKLWCPQTNYTAGTIQQNGYRHYRIRPLLMALYAVKKAQEADVEFNTDDLILSGLAYYWEDSVGLVTEDLMKKEIDGYVQQKAQEDPDYHSLFAGLMKDLKQRANGNPSVLRLLNETYAFQRKCRNAGNDAFCAIIFLRHLGWIETDDVQPTHWSCTQQAYPGTPVVPEYNIIRLTDEGEDVLDQELQRIPIWYRDIRVVRNDEHVFDLIAVINRLAASGRTEYPASETRIIEELKQLGLDPIVENNVITVVDRPVFELQYDMPDE